MQGHEKGVNRANVTNVLLCRPQRTFTFKGGEAEALKRLQHYLWGSDAVADYFNTRNGEQGDSAAEMTVLACTRMCLLAPQ